MEIIPAIDIISGKCVRLTKGDYKLKKIYHDSPLETARLFEGAGLKRLHLIDLEGAKVGRIKNWKVIEEIAKNTNLKIEFGGGVSKEKEIKKLLNLGIDRIILGSLVLKAPEEPRTRAKLGAGLVQNRSEASGSGFKKILKKFGPEKIVVSVDIRKNKICYRGWQKEVKKELSSFLEGLVKMGIKTIICTDIERDGTLKGPNFSLYKKLVSKFPNPSTRAKPRTRAELGSGLSRTELRSSSGLSAGLVPHRNKVSGAGLEIIASGGIRNIQDLKKLSKIGLTGAVIGKAIYEKKIKLADLKSFSYL